MKLNKHFQSGFERLALCESLSSGIVTCRLASLECLGVGASSGSKAINNETGAAYGTAINQAKQEFGDANTVFNDILQSTAPIAAAGPDQTGFSAQAESAINANTIDTTAAQYKNADTAVKSSISAQGGGNIALPSGANIGTEEALAEAGAQQTASGLRSNLQADYAAGNQNWQFAESALSKAPGAFTQANQATSEIAPLGKVALQSQDTINAAPSWQKIGMSALGAGLNAVAPGAGTILTSATSGGSGGGSSTGTSLAEGF
jgi:hypothetical protein